MKTKLKYTISILLVGLISVILFRSIFFSYEANVQNYKETHIKHLNKLELNDIVYIGRKTCPSCLEFVPKLADSVQKYQIDIHRIYYLNTDAEKCLEPLELKKFVLQNNIKSIPTIAIKGRDNKFRIKSFTGNTSQKEIGKFIQSRGNLK